MPEKTDSPTKGQLGFPVGAALSRGALRIAIELSIQNSQSMRDDFMRNGCRPPATFKGFDSWVQRQRARLEASSVLLEWGKLGRRVGFVSSTCVYFYQEETSVPVRLGFTRMSLVVQPCRLRDVDIKVLPLTLSAFAVERMFQRTRTLNWTNIRARLGLAAAHAEMLAAAYQRLGYRQCAVALDEGLLVGQLEGDVMHLLTFLPTEPLTGKWLRLYKALRRWYALAASDGGACAESLASTLGEVGHAWMREPHVHVLSQSDLAWSSRPVEEFLR